MLCNFLFRGRLLRTENSKYCYTIKVQLSILKSIAKFFAQADKSVIWTVTGILASVLGCLLSKAEESRVRWSAPWTLECEKRGGIGHCTFQVEALKDWAGEWRLKFNPLNYFFLSILFLNILASHRLWRFYSMWQNTKLNLKHLISKNLAYLCIDILLSKDALKLWGKNEKISRSGELSIISRSAKPIYTKRLMNSLERAR